MYLCCVDINVNEGCFVSPNIIKDVARVVIAVSYSNYGKVVTQFCKSNFQVLM